MVTGWDGGPGGTGNDSCQKAKWNLIGKSRLVSSEDLGSHSSSLGKRHHLGRQFYNVKFFRLVSTVSCLLSGGVQVHLNIMKVVAVCIVRPGLNPGI